MSKIEQQTKIITPRGKELRLEISEQVVSYIGAGFGLIASLAWNEAIKAMIEYFFPLKQDTVAAKFIYAGAMTLVLILVTMYLVRILKLHKKIEGVDVEVRVPLKK